MNKWWMAVAGGTKKHRLRRVTWSSGSCAPQIIQKNFLQDSTSLRRGRKKCAPCSATGSGAVKAHWLISKLTGPSRQIRSRSLLRVLTPFLAPPPYSLHQNIRLEEHTSELQSHS